MLLLPLLLGVAASHADAWQLVLAGGALSGYLASAALQAWSRARRPAALRTPILVYGGAFAILAAVLAVAFPPLVLSLLVTVPAAIIVFQGARPGTRRDLANSFAQVAQALILVPAAAFVAGWPDPGRVALYTLVAAAYLSGSVLVVRSVLRERGNTAFASISVAFHVALPVVAIAILPLAYALAGGWLAARAIALPMAQRRWAGGPHPLRPIHVGMIELVSSIAVVVTAFAFPL
jgi:YwiC-like protein